MMAVSLLLQLLLLFLLLLLLILLLVGGDVNQATTDGTTPLYVASENGHTDTVAILLGTSGIQINQATDDGRTPLMMAAISASSLSKSSNSQSVTVYHS